MPLSAVNASPARELPGKRHAREVKRLAAREAVLLAELREVRVKLAMHGNALSTARGYRMVLRGKALVEEANRG